MNILIALGIFIIATIVHEFGHWIGFKLFKYSPNIKFHWYGISVGDNCFFALSVKEALITTLLGILFGYAIIGFAFTDPSYILIYLLVCAVDITNAIMLLSIKPKDFNTPLLIIYEQELLRQKNMLYETEGIHQKQAKRISEALEVSKDMP